MNTQELYEKWLTIDELDTELKEELLAIAHDPKGIEERFYKELEFGTGGMRGIMGAGPNRMNHYMVQKVTAGLAVYLLDKFGREAIENGVIIAYDNRKHSKDFALEAALTLGAFGIRSYVFPEITPTPELSFTVRYLGAVAGIMITASHNTKEYNGYKVYDETGCQMVSAEHEKLVEAIHRFDIHENLPIAISQETAEQDKILQWLDERIHKAYREAVLSQAVAVDEDAKKNLHIVYTPLHGAGKKMVLSILEADGFTEVDIVKAQAEPDSAFSTVTTPNPEHYEAMKMAIDYAQEVHGDIVLATDPDSDRLGVAIYHQNEYVMLNGNMVGALLCDFLLANKEWDDKTTLIKTVVTSDLGAQIVRAHGKNVIETLTGFKYMGEQINAFQKNKTAHLLMAYEESYGYLIGEHARDKDGIVTALMIAEMAALYKKENMTLLDRLDKIYEQYGYYTDKNISLTFEGKEGKEIMEQMMQTWRQSTITEIAGQTVIEVKDYLNEIDGLPKSNVLKFVLENGFVAIRPSGTEPKIRFYISLCTAHQADGIELLAKIENMIQNMVTAKK